MTINRPVEPFYSCGFNLVGGIEGARRYPAVLARSCACGRNDANMVWDIGYDPPGDDLGIGTGRSSKGDFQLGVRAATADE